MSTSRTGRTDGTDRSDSSAKPSRPSARSDGDSPRAGRGRRSRAPKGEGPRLRDEILDACERLLLATGSAQAVSIRAVADAVGVTPPSIYRHFPDKDTLIFEVCQRHFNVLDKRIAEAVDGIEDPLERLQARGRAYVLFGRENPEPYRIMFMMLPVHTPQQAMTEEWMYGSRTFNELLDDIQACIDGGLLAEPYTEAQTVALGFWARVHGLTSLMVSKPRMAWSDDVFIDQYLRSCLFGIVA
jgi:AcrR family transcriptional regulator